jgi:hypothetical protein
VWDTLQRTGRPDANAGLMPDRGTGTARRTQVAAAVVASVLTADGLLHLFWATGGTWPAHDDRGLSLAVLGMDVPFTAPNLIPLAAMLFCGAGAVVARARLGRGHRFGRFTQLAALAVTCGVSARAAAGVVWACGSGIGLDAHPGSTFHLLNIAVYTPLCAGLAVAAGTVLRGEDPIRV